MVSSESLCASPSFTAEFTDVEVPCRDADLVTRRILFLGRIAASPDGIAAGDGGADVLFGEAAVLCDGASPPCDGATVIRGGDSSSRGVSAVL